ncbi:MAG: 1-acyl-sn-glycerol-3-phosphate acyltransferase [Deltaproteobacteria bacterium]|nr:1-acyl-sn-glycerol-3-phosphate acyltransferase [Deltaproteobacteria bacterium]
MSDIPPMPRDQLRGFERIAVPFIEGINRRPRVVRAIHATLGKVNGATILVGLRHLLAPRGLEHLDRLAAPKGLVLVSNHRSFFDMYVISAYVTHHTPLMKALLFPVRANFFYTHPLGALVNFAASGAVMWPPVFRDERKRLLNAVGFRQMAAALGPGVVIGIHPEGTRGKGRDPYTYLPVKPGLGMLVAEVDPEVRILPVFIAGMSSSFQREFGRNLRPKGQRGEPIRVRFGAALRAGDLQAQGLDAAQATEVVFQRVRELGEFDRQEGASGWPQL